MTVNDLITGSLQDLRVLAAGEVMSADDATLGLSRLNDWVDALKTESLTVYTITRTAWNLTASVASYTVGSGGTVNIDRPLSPKDISNIGIIDTSVSPTLEWLFGRTLTEQEYQNIPQKTLTTSSYPTAWYYNPTFASSLAVLKPFPISTLTTLQGVIYAPAPVGEFTSGASTVLLPPGYRRYFRAGLTIELATAFAQPVPGAIQKIFDESQGNIKRTNVRLTEMGIDLAMLPDGMRGMYDIWSDT